MKKLLLSGVAGCIVALSSCSTNDYHLTDPTNIGTLNVITTADGTTTISKGAYTVSRTWTNDDISGNVSAYGLQLTPDVTTNFSTKDQVFKEDTYSNYAFFQDAVSNTQNVTLKNADFLMTRYYYWPDINSFINQQDRVEYAYPGFIMVANYQIGETYKVCTFQPKTCYKGTTNTSYTVMGQTSTYTTEDIPYLLSVNLEDKTAKLVMFQAKFSSSEREPTKDQVILEGLTLSYENGVIKASGTDIVPLMVEGGASTPNENYTFSSVEFVTTNDILTECEINYVVHIKQEIPAMGTTMEYDAFGNFTGSYLGQGNPKL